MPGSLIRALKPAGSPSSTRASVIVGPALVTVTSAVAVDDLPVASVTSTPTE